VPSAPSRRVLAAGRTLRRKIIAPPRSDRSAAAQAVMLLARLPTITAVLRAVVLALADHVRRPVADADAHAVPCRTPGPRGWRPAQGHRRLRPREATTLSCKQTTTPRLRLPGQQLFNEADDRRCPGAICGQVIALDVHSSRPKRRSDDGQTILKTALEGWRLRSDLGKLVELRDSNP
jgi:hypothetical protein